MLLRGFMAVPLLLCLTRVAHLRESVSVQEMIFLLGFALLLPLFPIKKVYRMTGRGKLKFGFILLLFLFLSALFAPVIAPHSPTKMHPLPQNRYLSPLSISHSLPGETAFFPLGTDDFGRCVFSRLVYGSRVSLSIGVLAMVLAISIGALWGTLAGYIGGLTDAFLMRVVDGFLAFPRLFLLILVVAVWPSPPSVLMVVLVLGCLSWMGVARLIRGQILSLKERDFILASRQMGASHIHTIFHHLLPNAAGPVLVDATLRIGGTILVEAALSYLGLGVQPPTASWGNMIAGGKDVPLEAWWITTFPGLAIVITVMSFFLIGEGFKDSTATSA